MDSKILLGVIAVTIFGTFAVQGMMIQAGVSTFETIIVPGPTMLFNDIVTLNCPASHPFIISGTYDEFLVLLPNDNPAPQFLPRIGVNEQIDPVANSYTVEVISSGAIDEHTVTPEALCANFNFPMQMGMIGGELLDINTVSLLVGAIGTNPVITALIGITLAGVAGQVVWFVHRRKKKNE